MNDIDLTTLPSSTLELIITKAKAVLASRVEAKRVTVDFPSYNEKRYGSPWIARVTLWPVGSRPDLVFGNYLGDHRNGGAGEAEILAKPGDIVRWGQKDNRGNKNTEAWWGVVNDDATITRLTEAEARKAYSL
mgnify:FL=1